jgi:hypothetical protein
MAPLRAWAKREQQLIWITIAVLLMVLATLDPVIAFFTQLLDRVLLPVWEWIINKHPEAAAALASLVVAIQVFRSAHEHNQLSVRPLLDIAFGNYELNLFVSLVNNGTGPLILKSIMVIGAADPAKPLIDAMPDLPPDDLIALRYFASDPNGRSIRAAGGEIILLRLRYTGEKEFKNRFNTPRDTIRAALAPLTLHVQYTDIYKNPFETKRSLDYFLKELPERLPPPSD